MQPRRLAHRAPLAPGPRSLTRPSWSGGLLSIGFLRPKCLARPTNSEQGSEGYRIPLFYPGGESALRGKTSEQEDRVDVRFVKLERPRRIVEAVNFITTDPAFSC